MLSVEIPKNAEKLKRQIAALVDLMEHDTDEQSKRIHADALKASRDALEAMRAAGK